MSAADRMAQRRAVIRAGRAQFRALPEAVQAKIRRGHREAAEEAARIVARGTYLRPDRPD